jgi:parallel beta-helix repeat protein
MFSRTLGRSYFRLAPRPSRRNRRSNQVAPRAAEVLESRLLLSATLSVDPASTSPGVYHTIQAAVNAAPSGATIKVAPGTYTEDVTISKSLTLLGGQAIMRGEKGPSIVEYESTGFTVSSANKVTINGFTIEEDPTSMSTPVALDATNSANSTFENNVIVRSDIEFGAGVTHTAVENNSDPSGSSFFILVNGGTAGADADDTFVNNTLDDGGMNLDVSATGALVQGNIVTEGEIVNDANNVTVSHNLSDDADEGFIDSGNNNTYSDNTADNNGIGFGLTGGGTLTVTGNVASNNHGEGFFVAGSSTLTMKGNTADGNSGDGFDIPGVTAATLTSNTANNNAGGFNVSANSPTLTGNTASGNADDDFQVGGGSPKLANDTASGGQTGFSVDGVSPSITNCTATNEQFFGFETGSSGPATITGNTAKNGGATGFGFSLAIGGGTVFSNTADDDGGFGFSIASEGTLTVTGNQANNNVGSGISIAMLNGTVSGNTADANGILGFDIAGQAVSVVHNTANNNVDAGFALTLTGGTVSDNTATANQGPASNIGSSGGFVIVGSSNSITNNTADKNVGDGFVLDGLSDSTFSGNTADNNHGDGIHLVGSGNNTLSRNTADDNGNDGFDLDANSTANTLSNNTALGNKVFDLFDLSPGNGTAGTANTWTNNRAKTSDPPGLL